MKQLSRAQSAVAIQNLYKSAVRLRDKYVVPGYTLVYKYDAKDKSKMYDRRPMVLVLSVSRTHMLGLNFHWIPFSMRMYLVKYIIRHNKNNIKNGKGIDFTYRKLKPMMKKLGYAPCIRLYIRKRMSKKCIPVPFERIVEVAQLDMAMFTGKPEEVTWKQRRKPVKT